jgi:uncharacterized protein (DUF1501 family)
MQRKDFLRMSAAATAHPLLSPYADRVLVLLHLKGGNDGLNTVIPLDRYSQLYKTRPKLLIPEKQVLHINNTTGLHPAMAPVQELYKDGFVKIIQGVGIPDGIYAHARATKLWMEMFSAGKPLDPLVKESLEAQILKIAQLIANGETQSVYVLTLDGFDTHVQQMERHQHLLNTFSNAVAAFMNDCKRLHIEHKVTLVAFSEFGRRINSNTFGGTDHGTAQPVMIFGKNIQGGIVGNNPVLKEGENNLRVQYDYRVVPDMVYA